MSTIVTVVVRENRADFHGITANISLQGNGDPVQFRTAIELAMRHAGLNLAKPEHQRSPEPANYTLN